MAYKNFKPVIWAEQINRDLEKALVYAEDCNKQYEGKVAKMGDSVRILGVGAPTIKTQKGGDIKLENAETVEDSSTTLIIDTVSYYNYMIDDIDKRQAVGGVMEALSKEATYGLADEIDMAIANLAKDNLAVKADKATTEITKDNILTYIDANLQKLYENNVKNNGELVLTVPPWFYMLLKQAYVDLDTHNSNMIENGRVGKYGNVTVKMTNNIATEKDASLIQLKTPRAIAHCKPMTHTEPYRPEDRFSDAIKGFVLYGQKIVRPKELIVLNCKAK